MTTPTETPPTTDPIRDAFEAMLAFLTFLITGDAAALVSLGYHRSREGGNLLRLQALVRRAAEEHARRTQPADPTAEPPLTEEELRAAEERCERATPGPWYDTRYHSDGDGPHIETAAEKTIIVCALDVPEHSANGAFIAAARTDLPRALREIRRLRRVEALVGGLEQANREAHQGLAKRKAEIERLTRELARWTAPIAMGETTIADAEAAALAWQDAHGEHHPKPINALSPADRAGFLAIVRPHVARKTRQQREVARLTRELAAAHNLLREAMADFVDAEDDLHDRIEAVLPHVPAPCLDSHCEHPAHVSPGQTLTRGEALNPMRPAGTVVATDAVKAIVAAYQRHATPKDLLAGLPAEERDRILVLAIAAEAETGLRSTAPWARKQARDATIAREVAAYHARNGSPGLCETDRPALAAALADPEVAEGAAAMLAVLGPPPGGCPDGCGAAKEGHCWNQSDPVACAGCGAPSTHVGPSGKALCDACKGCDDGPPTEERSVGLYRKFEVRRVDGSSGPGGRHEHCDYLVLDWHHDPFAVPAARTYANACEAKYPVLAADLRAKAAMHGPVVTPAEEAKVIAGAPGQIGPGQTPIGRPIADVLAEIDERTAGPGALAGDGALLRRCAEEIRRLRADASRPGLIARIFAPIVAAQSTSWPVYSVLQKLADAADHLLRGHGCDRHGHEEVEAARDAAREILGATGIELGRFTARFAVDDDCCPPARGETTASLTEAEAQSIAVEAWQCADTADDGIATIRKVLLRRMGKRSTLTEEQLEDQARSLLLRLGTIAELGGDDGDLERAAKAALLRASRGEPFKKFEELPDDPIPHWHRRMPDLTIACNNQRPNEGATDHPDRVTCPDCVVAQAQIAEEKKP